MVNVRFISPGYFDVMGIPLLRGRKLSSLDNDRRLAVISERLAALLWPGVNPIGHRLATGSRVGEVEVAGVVRDVHNARLDQDPTLLIYVPYWLRTQQFGDLVVRTGLAPESLMPEVRRRLWKLDPAMPVPAPRTIAQLVSENTALRRLQMRISSGFGLAALALAALGIYGVVSYSATRRRKEIGIRLALGARPGEVLRMILAAGLRPAAVGLVAGLAGAMLTGRFVRSLLYQVSPVDPATLIAVTVTLALVACVAAALPARTAALADPARILRDE
jgi:putative ABC transport system permease protein